MKKLLTLLLCLPLLFSCGYEKSGSEDSFPKEEKEINKIECKIDISSRFKHFLTGDILIFGFITLNDKSYHYTERWYNRKTEELTTDSITEVEASILSSFWNMGTELQTGDIKTRSKDAREVLIFSNDSIVNRHASYDSIIHSNFTKADLDSFRIIFNQCN
jgi:hypothetical protein